MLKIKQTRVSEGTLNIALFLYEINTEEEYCLHDDVVLKMNI